VISSDLRRALRHAVAVAGFPPGTEPGLRPTGRPGQYAASIALTLGEHPRDTARGLAAALAGADWVEKAEITGPGYLTVTVTAAALAAVADRITAAGPGCAASDALAGVTVPAPPPGDPLAAATWEEARAALAARLTARLAAAAGATVAAHPDPERERAVLPGNVAPPGADITAAVAFAGRDAVAFALASAIPGRPVRVEPEIIARHVAGNPAYAVRYAHARAASGVRWARASGGDESAPRPPAEPGELALLDALSWLPERVAVAARRGRPDEFARYLEELAGVTVDALSSVSRQGLDVLSSVSRQGRAAPGSERLTLARAAQTGLAAGLGLLGVGAPERL
jgi:arginyl-tRNA synthetase